MRPYEDVFQALCEITRKAHALPGSRSGGRASTKGLASHSEKTLDPILMRELASQNGISTVAGKELYSGTTLKNDFTVRFSDGRKDLWIELKTPFAMESGLHWNNPLCKDSLPYAVAQKLPLAKRPYALLVLASSPHNEKETDRLVDKACLDKEGKWDEKFRETVATRGLGNWKTHIFQISRLYLFLKA